MMEEAAAARGLETIRADRRLLYIRIHGSLIPFEEMTGPSAGSVARYLCDNKHHARRLLAGVGLEVAPARVLHQWEFESALHFVEEVGFPVVVKPSSEAQGKGVRTYIDDPAELKSAMVQAGSFGKMVLVEKQFDGDDYRFFVVGDRVVSVTRRVRAHVTGDGTSSVRALIDAKNAVRQTNPNLRGYPIPTDLNRLTRLKRSGKNLSYVPAPGEVVTLRDLSNLAAGGDSVDVTDICHPGFKDVACRAVGAFPGLAYAGLDILARDITADPQPGSYIVSEVEFFPAPTSHFPVVGKPRDMAGAVLDYYLNRPGGDPPLRVQDGGTADGFENGNSAPPLRHA